MAQVLGLHVGDREVVSDCWPWNGSAPAIAAIRELNQWIEDHSLCSLYV